MTSRRPILSLCIPTYNRSDWLQVGLLSLAPMVQQAGGLVEVIVSDNCSTDDGRTARLVKETQSLYPIRYHRHHENIGGGPNMAFMLGSMARGDYTWVVGDDDVICNDGLTRVLAVLQGHPELDYVHVNHLLYSGTQPLSGTPAAGSVTLYNNDFQDRSLASLSEIVSVEQNCFTATYSAVLRRAHALEAFQYDTKALPFSTTATVAAHGVYIIENLLRNPAWYLGQPGVVASTAISWGKFQAQWGLVLMHDLYDLLEANGADPGVIETMRRQRLRYTSNLLWEMLNDPDVGHRDLFSLWEYQKRHGRYPETWQTMAELAEHANSLAAATLQKAA